MGNPVDFYSRTNNQLDPDLYLLLHFNSSDGSTTFTDSSMYVNTVTPSGDAQIDTAQSVFGGSSGLFDGTNDSLAVPDNVRGWNIIGSLTDAWTIDFRLRVPSGGGGLITGMRLDADNHWQIFVEGSTDANKRITVRAVAGGFFTLQNLKTGAGSIAIDTWYHIAVVIENSNVAIYIDGQQAVTEFNSNPADYATISFLIASSADLGIGEQTNFVDFNGWIDELAIRHYDYFGVDVTDPSGSFTVPTAEYDGFADVKVPINFYSRTDAQPVNFYSLP